MLTRRREVGAVAGSQQVEWLALVFLLERLGRLHQGLFDCLAGQVLEYVTSTLNLDCK